MKHTERDLIPNTPRNLRLDAGMSAKAVCDLTGVTAAAQSRFERTGGNPNAFTLAMFYAAVGRDDLVSTFLPVLSAPLVAEVTRVRADRRARYGDPVVPAAGLASN